MDFHNIKEIEQYYQKQLREGNSKAFDFLEDVPVVSKDDLQDAAETLKEYLQSYLQEYFDSYTPSIYERTGNFIDSIDIAISKSNGKLSATVFFEDDKAIRSSLWAGQQQADLPTLFNAGWQIKKDVWFKDIEHFGYFDGIGFIDKAVEDARNNEKFKGIDITIN